jgi:hypothetical protein
MQPCPEGNALVQHLQASRRLEERQPVRSAGPAVHVPRGENASVLERPGSRQPVVCHLFRARKADNLPRAITYTQRTKDQ